MAYRSLRAVSLAAAVATIATAAAQGRVAAAETTPVASFHLPSQRNTS